MIDIFHAPYTVTQPFGPSELGYEPDITWKGVYYPCFHRGADMVGPFSHCPIFPRYAGTVVFAGLSASDQANAVIIKNDYDQSFSCYWHFSSVLVRVGQQVDTSTQIGQQGATGKFVTGEHVHYEEEEPTADGKWRGISAATPRNPEQETADMTYTDFVKTAYAIFRPSETPSDDVINGHAGAIAAGRPAGDWLKTFVDDAIWRSNEDYNIDALTSYADAAGKGDGNPRGWAQDRFFGGNDFDYIVHQDIHAEAAQKRGLQSQIELLTSQLQEAQAKPCPEPVIASTDGTPVVAGEHPAPTPDAPEGAVNTPGQSESAQVPAKQSNFLQRLLAALLSILFHK